MPGRLLIWPNPLVLRPTATARGPAWRQARRGKALLPAATASADVSRALRRRRPRTRPGAGALQRRRSGHARHAVGRRVGVLGAAECGRRGPRRVRGGRRLLPLLPLLLLGRYGGVLGRGRRRLLARGGALRQLGDLEGLVELAAEELLDLLLTLLLLLLVRRAGPGGGRVTTAPE